LLARRKIAADVKLILSKVKYRDKVTYLVGKGLVLLANAGH
jgi:hypothetical protein